MGKINNTGNKVIDSVINYIDDKKLLDVKTKTSFKYQNLIIQLVRGLSAYIPLNSEDDDIEINSSDLGDGLFNMLVVYYYEGNRREIIISKREVDKPNNSFIINCDNPKIKGVLNISNEYNALALLIEEIRYINAVIEKEDSRLKITSKYTEEEILRKRANHLYRKDGKELLSWNDLTESTKKKYDDEDDYYSKVSEHIKTVIDEHKKGNVNKQSYIVELRARVKLLKKRITTSLKEN